MDLPLDERKLLTPGLHEVSLGTVQEHFGKFQRSDRRPTLFAKLCDYLDAVKKAGCGVSVIIDGSFVMACVDEPEDIDVILILPVGWDVSSELKPYQYNLVSKKAVKATYGFDQLTVEAGSADEEKWIEFFGRVNLKWRVEFDWPVDARKGILKVAI